EVSTRELFKAKHKENCEQARANFDRELLVHAKAFAQRPTWYNHQYEQLYSFGLVGTNVGLWESAVWLSEAFTPSPLCRDALARLRPADIRFLSPDDKEMPVDLPEGESYQINSRFGRPLARSEDLDEWFAFDDDTRRKVRPDGSFDDVKLKSGVTLR